MEIDAVQKLARNLEQTQGIEDEIQVMINSLKSSLENKYLNKATIFAKEQQQHTNSNPPKEVTLLKALSPFLAQEQQESLKFLNKQISTFQSIQTIRQGMNSSILEARSQSGNSSEFQASMHSNNLAGILLIMAILKDE